MSEPKVIWEIHVLTAVSPCSVCSHSPAPAPRSAQPMVAPLDSSRQLSPADGHGGCRRNAGGIRLSCFISCCLGQIPTLCQFLGASNCCSLWGTDVVSSVASVQPPDTSAEENSAHYLEVEFGLNRRHHFSPPDHSWDSEQKCGNVAQSTLPMHQALCCCVTLQPPGLKPRSSSKNWLEKLLPACVLTEEMAGLCCTGHASTRLLLYCGSSQAQLKPLENGIKSIFPNLFMLTDVSCLSSETGLFKNR